MIRSVLAPSAAVATMCLTALPGAADTPFATYDRASEAILGDPHDLAVGPDGRLYVADKFGGRIAIFDAETLEFLGSFGGGALSQVRDISFGPDGRAYAAVTGLSAVVVFDAWSDGAEPSASLGPVPRTEGALAHSNGRIYALASATGELVAIEGGAIVAAVGGHVGAHDVAEGPDGSVWVADNRARRIVRYAPDLAYLGAIEGPAYGFAGPRYIDFDPGGRLVVADQDAHRVLLIDPESGTLLGVLGDGTPGLGPGKFDDPEGVAAHGNAYFVSDSDNNRVVRYVVVLN